MSSPAATEPESIVMDWLGNMLKFPKSFLFSGGGGGKLQGTTCEAILCILTAARDKILHKIGCDRVSKLVVYGSDQTHCALEKAAQIAGFQPENFRAVLTFKSDSLVGTTLFTVVNFLTGLCKVAAEYGIWVHVDAAYAGSACICPKFRHFIDGVEDADSFSFNAHKWFFTTLDCCCLLVKNKNTLGHALSTNPDYLKNKATESKQVVDYKNRQIALSRGFRSLKLWLVLRSYGVANLRNFFSLHMRMAKVFERLISLDARFEVVVPSYFATVCDNNEINKQLLEMINASEEIYMTHAVIGSIYLIHFAVGATLTEETHVKAQGGYIYRFGDVF
ncbi:hypothetical protein LUZ61_010894 [Rhynchospora tenuis]|uniref:Uncharacterized protein n=1 Tax=Rhynchospora tenuis TaxID=198213 RepID=A0AAD6A0B8_9POAL|nr:hypothetical protein LUZ61_010894 [Rhynchospora tenuis]